MAMLNIWKKSAAKGLKTKKGSPKGTALKKNLSEPGIEPGASQLVVQHTDYLACCQPQTPNVFELPMRRLNR